MTVAPNFRRMCPPLTSIKEKLLQRNWVRKNWSLYRGYCVKKTYHGFISKYGSALPEAGSGSFTPESAKVAVATKLATRGCSPPKTGTYHSLIMTLTDTWGQGMVEELSSFGPVSVFDWWKEGFTGWGHAFQRRVPELNERFLEFVKCAHSRRPIDWVFITCHGGIILKSTIRRIKEELRVPVVNQWLDCVHTFELGPGAYGQDLGQCDIAADFDFVWTSSRAACPWYRTVGATPVFMPEGFSPTLTPKLDRRKTSDVVFLGACYGLRPDYIAALRRAGLRVAVAGSGWPGASPLRREDMGEFLASGTVVLGIGGVGYSMELATLKGRDFEVPGAGCAYLTTFNSGLAESFHVGEEILCYHSIDEMVELAVRVAREARFRCGDCFEGIFEIDGLAPLEAPIRERVSCSRLEAGGRYAVRIRPP